jgi:hypothetical protein
MKEPSMTGHAQDDAPTNAGSSTDQHITGAPETGTFTVDEAPAGDTPSHGSSNAGLNAARAEHSGPAEDVTRDIGTGEEPS